MNNLISARSPLAVIHFMTSMVATFRNAITAETHMHHAVQITLDFEGEFELKCHDQIRPYRCVIIPADLSHCVRSNKHWQLTLLLDAHNPLTKRLLKLFQVDVSPVEIPQIYYRDLIDLGDKSRAVNFSIHELSAKLTRILEGWVIDIAVDEEDTRIADLIELINESTSLDDVDKIISRIPLSKSRLSHLFVEQAGVTLRRYILWKRLRCAIEFILEGKSITDAAHDASFSDLPHLSRTFKNMFGINISTLFQVKDYIRLKVE